MKVYVNLVLSHERAAAEDASGSTHHVLDVVDIAGDGADLAEAFQQAWQQAGQEPLTEGVQYALRWERVEPPAPPQVAEPEEGDATRSDQSSGPG